MKKMVSAALAGLIIGLAAAPAWAAGDKVAGKAKSTTCAACHGMDGNSANPQFPKLAGQHASYIVKQLQDFQHKRRVDPTMSPQAANLSEQDMADLAAYYEAQPVKPGMGDEKKVRLGEMVYRGGNAAMGVPACIGCHGPTGMGNPAAKFPRLAGQHAKYVVKQMYDFRKGVRANDAGKMMRNVAIRMTDAEIEAVAEYIAGLHE